MVIRSCAIPGCYHFGPGNYCGEVHKSLGERGCILCRKAEKWGHRTFCGRCNATTTNSGPMLVPVPEDNEAYHNVANQFKKSWRHPTSCPEVREIYNIVTYRYISDRYNVYRNEVEVGGKFTSQGLTRGNQQRRWHGTTRGCNIGYNGQTSLCHSPQCSLCCIIRSSLDISHAKKKTGWGRFGRGIYASSTSSKSDDYSNNLVPSSWKALLLVHVVIGKAAEYTTDQTSLTEPPGGFDSVVGVPSTNGSLNYDEQVVYTNEAVCPAYLVMYRL